MENAKSIAEKALYLKAQEMLHLVELPLYSLDKPDSEIDKVGQQRQRGVLMHCKQAT